MNASCCVRRAVGILLLMVALSSGETSTLAQGREQYQGRPLADVLRSLQARGLRIVFSSAIVTPDLRVEVEPRAMTARRQLDELLAPHGLTARPGPGGTIQIVRAETPEAPSLAAQAGTIVGWVVDAHTTAPLSGAVVRIEGVKGDARTELTGRFVVRRVTAGRRLLVASMTGFAPVSQAVQVSDGATAAVTLALSPITSTHSEYVVVSQLAAHRGDHGVASATSVDGSHLRQLYGSLADDPIRVAHTLPHVTAIDDFRSEFTVRGSPIRHVDLVVDGVSTEWLQHTAYGRGATGSLPMLAGPVLQDVTLRAGAYPRRYGDRLGPQLELTVREGSRGDFRLRGAVGGTNVLLLGEGPLGRSARGSWLVAARQSYLEWPTGRHESRRAAFGFSDGLAKVAYDVRTAQRVSVTAIHGMSNVDGEDTVMPGEMGDGANRASMVTVSWRSTFGSALVVSQRVSLVRQQFINKYQSDRNSDGGANGEVAYRADITRPLGRGLLEGGAQLARTTIEEVGQSADTGTVAGSSSLRSGYLHYTWAATPTFTVAPGVRVGRSNALPHGAVSPWLLGEWTFRPGWVLTGSAGLSQQLPALRHVLKTSGSLELRPERASHVDVAIERRLDRGFRWRATAFSRREADILREPDRYPRLVDGRYAIPGPPRHANALEGTSHGIEIVAERRSRSGLSGWAAYAYGRTRYTDVARHETFWGDFDQRHALNLFCVYRFASASVGATFRTGTNFPVPGYLEEVDGRLFASGTRNQVRLPLYARLDLRADRQFQYFGHRLTLFAEVLNALNRANVGLANGSVHPLTGEAVGFTDTLLPRRASAGLVVEF